MIPKPYGKSHCGGEACGGGDGVDVYGENRCECSCETRCGPWNSYLDAKETEEERMAQPDDGHDWKQIATEYRAKNVELEREVFKLQGRVEAAEGTREHYREMAAKADDKIRRLEVAAGKVARREERFKEALGLVIEEHGAALWKLVEG